MMLGFRNGRMYAELHKIKIEINRHGSMYFVLRKELDEYKEDTGKTKTVDCVKGLFHVNKGYTSRMVDDGSNVRTKGQPMLLVAYDDLCCINIGDIVCINDKKYVINEINNVGEMNIVCDLSLEVILNGNS